MSCHLHFIKSKCVQILCLSAVSESHAFSSELPNRVSREAFPIAKSYLEILASPVSLSWEEIQDSELCFLPRGVGQTFLPSTHAVFGVSIHSCHVIFYCYCDGQLSFLPHPEGFGWMFQAALHTSAPCQCWNT